MSALIETLWRQFAVEAGEHLDAIERHLSPGDDAVPERERIAALFRSFHSLKGAARAMDLFAMEAVGHRAETILGRIRSGALPLETGTVDLLLEALDTLRVQTEVAVRERRDHPAQAALLARLESLGSPDGAARSGPQPTPPSVRLHDNERLLAFFVDHLREGMASLTRALDLGTLDADGVRSVDDTAERIEIGCERLSFVPFADTMRAFRAALAARDADGILRELQAIARAAARVGRLSNRDAGATILATLLADHNAQAIARAADAVGPLIDNPQRAVTDLPPLLDRMAATLDVAQLRRGASLLRGIAEALRQITAGSAGRLPPLLAEARGIIETIARGAAADPSEDADGATAARLETVLQTFADSGIADPGTPFSAEELNALGLDPKILRFLSPESTALLRAALADPDAALHEVTAFIESSPTVASGFTAWLSGAVTAITNWPEFVDGRTWLKILVATPKDPATLRDELATIDPDGQLLRVRACAGGQPGPVAPPASAPATFAPAPAAPETGTLVPSQPVAPAPTAVSTRNGATAVLRVPGEVVDRFMARVDTLVLLSGELNAIATDRHLDEALAALVAKVGSGDPAVRVVLERLERRQRALVDLDSEFSRSVDRLREAALDLRVVPVETLFSQFPRLVRELARAQGKKVRLALDGGEVRIDKSMVEQLYDPLLHMVRNALDHGIEAPEDRARAGKPDQATISLVAIQRGNRVLVQLADDGRGIDTARVRAKAVSNGLVTDTDIAALADEQVLDLIFAPGFSTADTVTETSGRGVGMDVVRETVTRLGGTVAVQTKTGAGTAFAIDLPLSAAIVRTLLVQVGDQVLAIPDRAVEEVCAFGSVDFHRVAGCRTILRRDRVLPVVALADCLGLRTDGPGEAGYRLVVVLRHGDRRIGVTIDKLLRRGDLFVRDSHPGLAAVPGLGGVSLLNDGRIVLILDGDALFRLACAAQLREAARVTVGS